MPSDFNQSRPVRVMIVDDHPIVRIGISKVLEFADGLALAGEADSVESAVSAAAELKPDVILMDVNLPDGSGLDAVARICAAKNAPRIIMLTSHDSDEYLIRALEAGATGYCLKGLEPEQLRLAILSVYGGAIWFDSISAQRILSLVCRNNDVPDIGLIQAEFAHDTGLSEREREVLELLAGGLSNHDVAERLRISVPTVKTHVRSILKRLGVADRTQAAIKAVRMQIVRD
ncbi:MAG TPA: response regulator transcription factor [Candidatus Melainabacteria bacterium]|nr:response regulator transcription factor [Candidatus Melainabacteria bacterium]